MRAPEFWRRAGIWPALLSPAAGLLRAGALVRRAWVTPYRANLPVVCVGNLVAGGAGKTPLVLNLARQLQVAGRRVAMLSRGYGGRLRGPHRVDPARDNAADVGDEALLLAAAGETWIARDRAAGARAIETGDADLILMDDGYQNPGLIHTVSLLVIDHDQGFGNGRLLPAGPLREPLTAGLARADAVVGYGARPPDLPLADKPYFAARLTARDGNRFAGRRCLAFAGIGRPRKFADTLRACDAEVAGLTAFADHHPYSAADARALIAAARATDAELVTTAKDWVRCPPDLRAASAVLEIDLTWAAGDNILAWLESRLEGAEP